MKNSRQRALKYSKSLLALCQKEGVTGKVQNDLATIVHSFKLGDKPWGILQNPFIGSIEKERALAAAFRSGVESPTLKLLAMLIRCRHLALLPSIAENFNKLADDAAGIVRGSVRSALPLSSNDKTALENKLESFFGKKILLESKEDSSLIAGITIKAGDYLFENNARLALRQLREALGCRPLAWTQD